MYYLWQSATLDGWADTLREIKNTDFQAGIVIVYLLFVIVTAFGFTNLIIGRAVFTMNEACKNYERWDWVDSMKNIHLLLKKLRGRVVDIVKKNPELKRQTAHDDHHSHDPEIQ